jgi:hypothetical protein
LLTTPAVKLYDPVPSLIRWSPRNGKVMVVLVRR